MNLTLPGLILLAVILAWPAPARADCANPAAEAASIVYNSDHNVMQYCNGSYWVAMGSGGLDTVSKLDCSSGQIAKWDGSAWACAADDDSASIWSLSGSDTYYNAGNVGIGTDTPGSYRLRVDNSGGGILSTSTSSYGGYFTSDSASAVRGDSTDSYGGYFNSTNSYAVRAISANGHGVRGDATGASGYGGYFISNASHAVRGVATGEGYGGYFTAGVGKGGIIAYTNNGSHYGIVGHNNAWSFYGNSDGYFAGDLEVNGSLDSGRIHSAWSGGYMNLQDTSASGDGAAAYVRFLDANGDRTGYVGDGSSGASYIRIQSDNDNVYAYGTGGGCYVNTGGCASDIRLKQDIQPLEGALDKLVKLNGVSFEWKKNPGTHYMGFIAQEVEKQFPILVETEPDDGYKTVNYNGMTAPIVEAIKELKAENDNLRTIVVEQGHEIEAIKARLEAEGGQ